MYAKRSLSVIPNPRLLRVRDLLSLRVCSGRPSGRPLHASAPEVRQRLAQPVRAGNAPPILHSAGGAADYLKTKREQLRECHGLPIDRTPQMSTARNRCPTTNNEIQIPHPVQKANGVRNDMLSTYSVICLDSAVARINTPIQSGTSAEIAGRQTARRPLFRRPSATR
jgi:hypothetical protein